MPQLLDPTQTLTATQGYTPQQPLQTDVAQPQVVNPDAPQVPQFDSSGNPTDFHASALNLVQTFDNFVNTGGDLSKLNKQDFDNVLYSVQNLPDFANKTDSPSAMYALFQQGKKQNLIIQAAERGAGQTALSAVSKAGDLWTAGTEAAGKTLDDIGDYLTATLPAFRIIPEGMDLWNTITKGDTSGSNIANMNARADAALVRALRGNWDTYTKDLPQGVKDVSGLYALASQAAHTSDPDAAARLDFQQSEILRGAAQRAQQSAKNLTDAQTAAGNVLKSIGLVDAGNRLATATPSEGLVSTAQMLTDPANYVMGLAEPALKAGANAVVGQFIKAGIRGERLADATAALAAADNRMASIASARASMSSILVGDIKGTGPTLTDEARAGMQSNLARLKTVEGYAKRDYAAVQDEYGAAVADYNQQLDRANQNPFRQMAGNALQNLGDLAQVPSQVGNLLEAIPQKIAATVVPGADEATKDAVAQVVKRWGEGSVELAIRAGGMAHGLGVGALVGGPVGAVVGGIAGPFAPEAIKAIGGTIGKFANLDTLTQAGKTLGIIGQQYALGQQTLPFWRDMANKLDGVSSWIASKMDNQLVYAMPSMATGGLIGAGIGGGMGLAQGVGDPRAFQQGLAMGGMIGAAGGGLGQLMRFNSPAELRQAAIGDRARFIGSMSPPNKAQFLKLHPDVQLAMSVYGMAHPDAEFRFFSDPTKVNGQWIANNPKSIINVNVLSDNPLQAVAAHEVGHHLAAHGLQDQAVGDIIGNPLKGQPGIMTALDQNGHPLTELQPDGSRTYVNNDIFERYKSDYNARLQRDNPSAPPATDRDVALEMFADLHAQQMANPTDLQKVIRGYVPSDLVGNNVTNNWLTKMGMGADATTGNPIPTSTLEQARSLQDAVRNYYTKQTSARGDVNAPHRADTPIPTDVVKGTPGFDMVQTQLDATGDYHRNPDGTIAVGMDGRPVLKTAAQADADAAKLGKAVSDIFAAQPHLLGAEGDNYVKWITTSDGRRLLQGQRVREEMFNQLEATNQFNANQMLNWRKADGAMQLNNGSMMRAVYNTPQKGGKYRSLAARERSFVPIWTEIPQTDQVIIKGYDPEQLTTNITKAMRSPQGKSLYNSQVGPALEDAHTYLANLAADRPGGTGLGDAKKSFLNAMFGFPAAANPDAATLSKRSPDVIKSFRLDRLNRIREMPGQAEAFHEKTYGQLTSYFQPRAEPVAAAPQEVGETAVTSGMGEKPEPVTPAKLTREVTSDEGFAYHATNMQRLYEIADSGKLKTHRAHEFTDQDTWPDGSTEKRAYFSHNAGTVWAFAPEDGTPVLVRTPNTGLKVERTTKDIYSQKPISAKRLEYLGQDGNWHPVDNLVTPKSEDD